MKKEYKDLFEAASEISKHRVEKSFSSRHSFSSGSEELQREFQRCKKMHDEINRGLEHAFYYADIEPHAFRAFISKPQHFSKAEWKEIQSGKTLVEQMLRDLHLQVKGASGSAFKESGIISEENSTSGIFSDQGEKQDVRQDLMNQTETGSSTIGEQKVIDDKKKKKGFHRRDKWLNMH